MQVAHIEDKWERIVYHGLFRSYADKMCTGSCVWHCDDWGCPRKRRGRLKDAWSLNADLVKNGTWCKKMIGTTY